MIYYCAHKYGGDPENKRVAENIIRQLQLYDKTNLYLSPIHALGWQYRDMSYMDGIKLCFMLLSKCDELLILSEESEGVRLEIGEAKRLGIPVKKANIEWGWVLDKNGIRVEIDDCTFSEY